MSTTDFFDDDLIQHRDSARSIKMGPGGESPPPSATDGPYDGIPGRPVSDFNLTRMAKHKEEVEDQVAHASEELERLRQRQESLEREKQTLEELRRKQADYERGKQDLLEQLNQSLLTLERDEVRAGQTCEMLAGTRVRFKEMLGEIEALSEESWSEETFRDELNKALAMIEDARIEFGKGRAKVQAVLGVEKKSSDPAVVFEEAAPAAEKSFLYWLKAGFAATLPLIITIILLGVFFYLRTEGLL